MDAQKTPKKRKRDVIEAEAAPPRITYDAATRTFDRLFKEDNLEAMKAVVRTKLGISDSIPLHLSQWRDGKSVDLEDDDDFEAFQAATRASSVATVKVVLGGTTSVHPLQTGGPEPLSISVRSRKKKKRYSARVSSSPTESAPPIVNGTQPNQPTQSDQPPPTKKARVTFGVPPPGHQVKGIAGVEKKLKGGKAKTSVDQAAETNGQGTIPNGTLPNAMEGNGRTEETGSTSSRQKKKKAESKRQTGTGALDEVAEPTPKATKATSRVEKALAKDKAITDGPASVAAAYTKALAANADGEDQAVVSTTTAGKRKKGETLVVEPESAEPADEELSRPAKKSKKKHTNDDEGTTPASKSEKSMKDATEELAKKKGSKPKKDKVQPDITSKPVDPREAGAPDLVEDPPVQPEEAAPSTKRKGKDKKEKSEGATTKKAKESSSKVHLPEDSTTETVAKKQTKKGSGKDKVPEPDRELEESHSNDADAEKETESPDEAPAKYSSKPLAKTKRKSDILSDKAPADEAEDSPEKQQVLQSARDSLRALMAKKLNDPSLTRPAEAPAQPPPQPPVEPEIIAESEPEQQEQQEKEQTPKETTPAAPSAKASKTKDMPGRCPFCLAFPTHARSKCPIIKAGIRFMRKHIAELEKDTSGDHQEQETRKEVIAELKGIIEKRTKKPYKPAAEATVPEPELQEESSKAPLKGTKAAKKQVDAVVSHRVVVDLVSPPASIELPASSRPSTSTAIGTKLPATRQRSSSSSSSSSPEPPLSAQRASSSQKDAQKQGGVSIGPSQVSVSLPNLEDPHFLEFGDVTMFTEKDLESIVHGPRKTLDDVLSSTDDEEDEEEGIEPEEDEEEATGAFARKWRRGKGRYPSSEEEEEEDEDEDVPQMPRSQALPIPSSEKDEQSRQPTPEPFEGGNATENPGDISFGDVDDRGSSREVDMTGNAAVDDALGQDFSPFQLSEPPPSIKQKSGEADSDTAVASQGEDDVDSQPEPNPGPDSAVDEHLEPAASEALDPIEPSEGSPRSNDEQPEPIASDDDVHPIRYTPPKTNVEVVLRPRSHRNKPAARDDSAEPRASTQPAPTTDAGDSSKQTRRTRSLTKITDLPMPLNPSARVIKPTVTPSVRTRRSSAAQHDSRVNDADEDDEDDDEDEAKGPATRTRKSAAAATTASKKAPAKGKKTSMKPPSKVTTITPAKPPSKATKVSAISATAANSSNATRARANRITLLDPKVSEEEDAADGPSEISLAPWTVLPEDSSPQVNQTPKTPMVDELTSSPNARVDPVTPKGKNTETPLFLHSESQQSFPWSQYPGIQPKSSDPGDRPSPNDSEDEDEVEKTVVKPTVPAGARYRPLTQIKSSQTFAAPRFQAAFTPSNTKATDLDFFGSRKQAREEGSDDSDTDSDSDTEKPPPASHIPAERMAGVSSLKRK